VRMGWRVKARKDGLTGRCVIIYVVGTAYYDALKIT